MALFSAAGIQFLLRWLHFLSGITWIGLLYYFNFVQGPFFAEADASTRSVATQKLVPRALWWFRWSAMVTFLSGLTILILRRASWSDPWGITILTGAAFGTVIDRKSTRLNSSHGSISYAVFCLKKKRTSKVTGL